MIGPRGLSVLIFAGLVALALAVVGWTQRDGGVLGLAVCLTGCQNQRLVLRN